MRVRGEIVATHNESMADKEAVYEAEEDGLQPPNSLQWTQTTQHNSITASTTLHQSTTVIQVNNYAIHSMLQV